MATAQQPSFRWPLFGNEHVRSYLETAVTDGTLSHCYLFSGPEGLGKKTYARTLAQMLMCRSAAAGRGDLPCGLCPGCRQAANGVHPDVVTIGVPEGKKNVGVESVRSFIATMEKGTFGSRYKVGIIETAEALSAEAANALLKTLEEPRGERVIILLATHHEHVPATIVSRAQLVRFRPVKREAIYDYLVHERASTRDFAKSAAELAFGRPGLAVRFLEDNDYFVAWRALVTGVATAAEGTMTERLGQAQEMAAQAGNGVPALVAWQVAVRERMLHELGLDEAGTAGTQAREWAEAAAQASLANRQLQANLSAKTVFESLALYFTI